MNSPVYHILQYSDMSYININWHMYICHILQYSDASPFTIRQYITYYYILMCYISNHQYTTLYHSLLLKGLVLLYGTKRTQTSLLICAY